MLALLSLTIYFHHPDILLSICQNQYKKQQQVPIYPNFLLKKNKMNLTYPFKQIYYSLINISTHSLFIQPLI